MRLAPPHRPAMLMLASIQLVQHDYAAASHRAGRVDAPDANDRLKAEARVVLDRATALLRENMKA